MLGAIAVRVLAAPPRERERVRVVKSTNTNTERVEVNTTSYVPMPVPVSVPVDPTLLAVLVVQARAAGVSEGRQAMWLEVTATPRWRVVVTHSGKTLRASQLVPYVTSLLLAQNAVRDAPDSARVELVCEEKESEA